MRTGLILAAAILLSAAAAWATEVTDAVPGHPGVTYQKLLTQIMPDLAKNKDGNWTSSDFANLLDMDGKPSDATDITFSDIETKVVRDAGKKRILVLTGQNMREGFSAILGVFDDTAKVPKLLDYRDVGGDRSNDFRDQLLALSPDTDAFLIDSNHLNAGESFESNTILYLDHGKLREATNLFTYGLANCEYTLAETPSITTRPDPGHAFNAIVLRATQVVTHSGDDCGAGLKVPKKQNRTFTDTYHWDAKKKAFVPATNSLAGLIGPEE